MWALRTGVNSATIGPGEKRDALMAEGRWRECHKPQERSLDAPAPTVTSQTAGWSLPDWCFNRPSTTIVGSFKPEIVAAPGYRTTVSRQNAPDSVRVTVHEAGVLQSFPADYPWQGAKGKQYLQAGNAVPPLLAAHALAAATSIAADRGSRMTRPRLTPNHCAHWHSRPALRPRPDSRAVGRMSTTQHAPDMEFLTEQQEMEHRLAKVTAERDEARAREAGLRARVERVEGLAEECARLGQAGVDSAHRRIR